MVDGEQRSFRDVETSADVEQRARERMDVLASLSNDELDTELEALRKKNDGLYIVTYGHRTDTVEPEDLQYRDELEAEISAVELEISRRTSGTQVEPLLYAVLVSRYALTA